MQRNAGEQVLRPLDIVLERAQRSNRPPFAVVDIGSNSVRLVIYDELSRAPFPRFNEKSFCRLAEGLEATGRLAEDGFRRAVEALRRFRAISSAMGVGRIDVLATEATRRAANGPELVAAITAETGLTVKILSGAEEATYAGLGVISGFFRPTGIVGDMGGGSLEIIEALDDKVGSRTVSMPIGALPVGELRARQGAAAKDKVDAILRDRLPPGLAEPVFYAVGGGWRALAKAHMGVARAAVRTVHGYSVAAKELRDFAKDVWRSSAPLGPRFPDISPRRLETLPAAALVMERLLKRLAPDQVIFSALGVREGWLYAQLPERERYFDPLIEGAQAFGVPRARVPAFAVALADWTAELQPGEKPADTRLRVAACALSDVAWRDHVDLRAPESFRRLIQFPFTGIDHAERAYLAAIIHARYGGRASDPCLEPANRLLSPVRLRRARILGQAMQLAYRFSGVVPEILVNSRLVVTSASVYLEVGEEARASDSEEALARLQALAATVGAHDAEIRARGG